MSDLGETIRAASVRWVLSALAATWRIRVSGEDNAMAVLNGHSIAVIAFWHSQMFPIWYRFRKSGAVPLISGSRDGDVLDAWLRGSLGYRHVIRGSSSRGGSDALNEMVRLLPERSCMITPDGPRGPARQAKAGALVLAWRTGRPLLLAGWTCRRSIRLGSWDRMQLPIPFSKVYLRLSISDPIVPGATSRFESDDLGTFSTLLDSAAPEPLP